MYFGGRTYVAIIVKIWEGHSVAQQYGNVKLEPHEAYMYDDVRVEHG